MKPDVTWRVIYIAHGLSDADSIERLLLEEGFLVQRGTLDRSISVSGIVELRVLASEAEEARRFILEKGL